jgi:Tfp pilus assembly protein PilF
VVELRGAIERDPLYALAWAGLADAYNNLGSYCVVPPGDAFPKAKAAAVRALELDPSRAEAHISIAFATQYFDWDWETAGCEYRLGISLNDAYPTAHHWYGWYLICLGQLDAAERSMRRALELDPLSLPITTNLGFCMYFARRFSDAIAQFHRALELGGEFAEAHRGLGEAYEHLGELDVAVANYRRALEYSGGSTEVIGALGRALAKAGHVDEAVQLLGELDRIRSVRYVSMHEQAMVRLGLGRLDEALQCLERGIGERSYKSVYLRVDPDVDPLRNDPRFARLLDAVGLTRLNPPLE